MDAASPGLVLVVDDDDNLAQLAAHWLASVGFRSEVATTGAACFEALGKTIPDAVLLDLQMPDVQGLEVLQRIRRANPRLPVVIITIAAEVETVVAAMQNGAFDYLPKPLDRTKLITTVRNAVEQSRLHLRVAQLEREVAPTPFPGIVGRAPAMRALFSQMERVAPSDVTVLIHGESGTGKELVARALHDNSGRRDKDFVALNCAAIPETLQESELFGHEKGSFTGAMMRRIGRFEQADGGTLFLDEIGELSPTLQSKLLRVFQERRFHRVGGTQEITVNVRIIAATHRDLGDMIRAGQFREDLFYRLAVFELEVPSLRKRAGDVGLLAQYCMEEITRKHGLGPLELAPETIDTMARYAWPGNVRQLQNALERAIVVAVDGVIRPEDLPLHVRLGLAHEAPPAAGLAGPLSGAGLGTSPAAAPPFVVSPPPSTSGFPSAPTPPPTARVLPALPFTGPNTRPPLVRPVAGALPSYPITANFLARPRPVVPTSASPMRPSPPLPPTPMAPTPRAPAVTGVPGVPGPMDDRALTRDDSGTASLDEVTRRAIQDSLVANHGNVSEVCRQLGIPRTTIYRMLKRYGLR